jgi:hypothetical protein
VRRYEVRDVTVQREVLVEESCDGCGATAGLIPVAIEVNDGEEFGRRDEYDYCDDCLMARADLLIAAGSRAELVTGVAPADPEDAP